MAKILVCGGREFDDRALVFSTLDAVNAKTPITCVVTGAQRKKRGSGWIGADYLGEEWARERQIAYRGHPAPWDTHGEWCRCTRAALFGGRTPEQAGMVLRPSPGVC